MLEAFADELVKIASSYPISRALTGLRAQTARQAIHDALANAASFGVFGAIGGAVKALPLVGSSLAMGLLGAKGGPSRALAARQNFAQSTLARMLEGGGHLMGHEKARLAEATGLAPERLELIIRRIAKKDPAKFMTPAESAESRFVTSKWFPMGTPDRFVHARALAARAKDKLPLLQSEQHLIDLLRSEHRKQQVRSALPYLGAAGLAGGSAFGAKKLLEHEFSKRSQ